jgi:hypothetical protein
MLKARLLALSMAVAKWADSMKLRQLFPTAARSRLHAAKKWLFHQPVRFVFDRSGATNVVRLVVTGEPFADWLAALTAAETWHGVPQVAEVVLKLDDSALNLGSLPPPSVPDLPTIVLPLRENATAACPRGLGLYPSPNAVAILRDKRRFADYVIANGLARLCPAYYAQPQDIELPCIVKPTYDQDRAVVVRTREALAAVLSGRAATERFVFQEFIPGTTEYTLHCIVRHGRPVWTAAFTFEKEGDARVGVEFRTMARCKPSAVALEALERLLGPLDYSGPCNMDYTLRLSGASAGELAVFEINPRFGGTLFLADNRDLLVEALTCLVTQARLVGATRSVRAISGQMEPRRGSI